MTRISKEAGRAEDMIHSNDGTSGDELKKGVLSQKID
jgi:hypothetical protein